MDFDQLMGNAKNPQVQQLLKSVMGPGAAADGLNNLLDKLAVGGMQEQVKSWVGSGANVPVSTQQIEGVLGNDVIDRAAKQAGLSHKQAAADLAESLPEFVNQASPYGMLAGFGAPR
jgi:uncharacterized protein YidB (DUF937 family)